MKLLYVTNNNSKIYDMKKRIEWIDIVRGIAMYFVILGHAFLDKTNVFRKYIYSFHMPLFFFISGLTYVDKDISFKDFIKNKLKKIILPYIIINLIVFIIKYIMHLFLDVYNGISITLSLKALLNGLGNNLPCIQSWFLLCLMSVEIIFYLFKKISKNDIQLLFLVIATSILGFLYSSYQGNTAIFWHIDTSLVALLFYFLGYIYMKNMNKIKIKNNTVNLSLMILVFILSIIFQKYNLYISMNANRYGNIILFLLSSICSIIFYVKISMLIENKDRLFKYIGVHSIFFLGYHAFFLTIIKTYIPELLVNNILTIIVSVVAVLVIIPICEVVYKKCPILIGKIR